MTPCSLSFRTSALVSTPSMPGTPDDLSHSSRDMTAL
jgi:hypothetical protein